MPKSTAGGIGLGRSSLAALTLCLVTTNAAPAAKRSPAPCPASLGRGTVHDVVAGQLSCATSHVPAWTHAQSDTLAVRSGNANPDVAGFRAVPTLRYLNSGPPLLFQKDGTPIGGFNRDRRADDPGHASRPDDSVIAFLGTPDDGYGMATGTADTTRDPKAP